MIQNLKWIQTKQTHDISPPKFQPVSSQWWWWWWQRNITVQSLESVCACSGEGSGSPFQSSCLENPMDGGAWKAAVHGVTEGRTQLSYFTFTFHFHALEKEMAAHSSVLAWRIPGTGEPGGLPSMGSHRVRHDWSDLAAAADPPSFLFSAMRTAYSRQKLSLPLDSRMVKNLSHLTCTSLMR